MMRPQQILTLALAGVALAGIGVWLATRHDDAQAQTAVFPELKQADLNAVTRVRIFRGDGSHATLVRDQAHWVVSERNYPADSGQVRKLLLDIASLQVEEPKTADPALYARIGVEDPTTVSAASTGVDIEEHGRTLGLIVGKTSGTRAVYLRVTGARQSLLANPQLTPDADPRHWLDRSILDIAPDQISQVDLQLPGGPDYTLKRAAAGATPEYLISPVPKGREPGDLAAASQQMGALAGLQLDDVRKASGVAAAAHATFHTTDGLTLQIAGIPVGSERYVSVVASGQTPAAQARSQELNARLAGWEFELPGYRYDSVFRPLEPLLKPKPQAVPKAAAAAPHPGAKGAGLPFGPHTSGGQATPEQSH